MNEATIANYARDQEKTGQMIDKIGVKEQKDPLGVDKESMRRFE
jgi:hypothetical protein